MKRLIAALAGLVGVTYLARKLKQSDQSATSSAHSGRAEWAPLAAAPSTTVTTVDRTWVVPVEGQCPTGFPVKAKDASMIYHIEGGLSYERTNPERCYRTGLDAEADGYRAARR